MLPSIDAATDRMLDRLGVEAVRPAGSGCCGAIRHHLNDQAGAANDARRNIAAWWPLIEAGAEAVLIALADMPRVTVAHCYRLFDASDNGATLVASSDGVRPMPPAQCHITMRFSRRA